MDDNEFNLLIDKAVKNLPNEFKEKIDNVLIITQPWPTQEQLNILRERGEKGVLLGLYEGIPRTKRGKYGIGGALPDRITIFKNPLLMISANLIEAKKNIKLTVIHEIAHHFGLSDNEIRKVEHGS